MMYRLVMKISSDKSINFDKVVTIRISKEMIDRARRLNINLSEEARFRWAQVIEFRELQLKEKQK